DLRRAGASGGRGDLAGGQRPPPLRARVHAVPGANSPARVGLGAGPRLERDRRDRDRPLRAIATLGDALGATAARSFHPASSTPAATDTWAAGRSARADRRRRPACPASPRLAHWFVALAHSGRLVLVETHSALGQSAMRKSPVRIGVYAWLASPPVRGM